MGLKEIFKDCSDNCEYGDDEVFISNIVTPKIIEFKSNHKDRFFEFAGGSRRRRLHKDLNTFLVYEFYHVCEDRGGVNGNRLCQIYYDIVDNITVVTLPRRKSISSKQKIGQKISSFEEKVIYLIELHNLPFKFVGNGGVLIGNKRPDFICTDERKLIIETYSEWFHPVNYEVIRSEFFSSFGYETLFLNGQDLSSDSYESICLEKINTFLKEGKSIYGHRISEDSFELVRKYEEIVVDLV